MSLAKRSLVAFRLSSNALPRPAACTSRIFCWPAIFCEGLQTCRDRDAHALHAGVFVLDRRFHTPFKQVSKLIDQAEKKRFFIGEVKVDRAFARAGALHDVIHARGVITLAREHIQRRVEDAMTRAAGVAFPSRDIDVVFCHVFR